jgi:Permease family
MAGSTVATSDKHPLDQGITGIKSRFVVAVGGGILVFLGLFPILGALVALVPLPVLGGAGLALFGTVAASGIRTLSKVDFARNANLVIVAFSLAMGIIPIAVPTFYDRFPEWFQVIFDSGITAAAITAVLLNIVFNIIGRKERRRRRSSLGPQPSPRSLRKTRSGWKVRRRLTVVRHAEQRMGVPSARSISRASPATRIRRGNEPTRYGR